MPSVRRVLVIAPHADDETIGAGGTIARHAAEGDDVHVAIVTGHGGMREFCDERTAWLVDYRFTDAQSHFELFGSAWTEPLTDDLVRVLREVHGAPPEERTRRGRAARETVEALFTWPAVARRTRRAVAELDRRPALSLLPRVAWVTSWNSRCGIASYAHHLACEFPKSLVLHCQPPLRCAGMGPR